MPSVTVLKLTGDIVDPGLLAVIVKLLYLMLIHFPAFSTELEH